MLPFDFSTPLNCTFLSSRFILSGSQKSTYILYSSTFFISFLHYLLCLFQRNCQLNFISCEWVCFNTKFYRNLELLLYFYCLDLYIAQSNISFINCYLCIFKVLNLDFNFDTTIKFK